jgi:hypothetical protein
VKVTVSLNEALTSQAVGTAGPDLRALARANSDAEVLRVFGRGRFVSIEVSPLGLQRLKQKLGALCLFAMPIEVVPFEYD